MHLRESSHSGVMLLENAQLREGRLAAVVALRGLDNPTANTGLLESSRWRSRKVRDGGVIASRGKTPGQRAKVKVVWPPQTYSGQGPNRDASLPSV